MGQAPTILSLATVQFPNIVPPEILVQANHSGADAKTLEQSVVIDTCQQTIAEALRDVVRRKMSGL